jgi:23S rRNA (guanosine2251-2'-O)-methyltransferase
MVNAANTIIFEGMTSVSALISAIRNGNAKRRINRIIFSKSKIKKAHGRYIFIKKASEDIGFDLSVVDDSVIEEIASGITHGGILAEVTEAEYKEFDPMSIKKDGFAAIIEGVEDPFSLGYSLRTLYACGCDCVILPRHLPSASDSALCKSSAGASELLDIYLGDTSEIASAFKDKGYRMICAAIPDSLPCYEADLSLPLLLVIGGEKRGISSKLLQMKDLNVRIPYGVDFMGSLSTSSAVSILSYEVLRQNTIK